ncbi:Spy0128 family protein [Enorma massiliensis]|uniref:Spy0128 family protein n=1 Tax=Enorma massiliensis TaxID=1472761 RepID=UPI001EF3DF93|nr:FctA domain-containing protein [Enorma massiliensis]
MAVALIAVTVVSFANVARAADAVGTTVVDPDTTNVWTEYTRPGGQPSTQNVGRIWTDKSVFDGDYSFTNDNDAGLNGKKVEKGDSDFLVSLSALSSTSNLKEMVQTGKPLDIVLVLDDSGSMDYLMAVYDDGSLDKNQTYHTEDGSDFWGSTGNEVTWNEDRQEWGYYSWNWGRRQWNRVTPKTSPDDGNRDHTQLYGQSRTSALQAAVNNFIDQAAAANGEIQNQDNKHRISIVVFGEDASTENGLTVCEGNGANQLKNTVNNLDGYGSTNAGAGMQHAERVLSASQRDAAQVVIFFTDGVPTTSDTFSPSVANRAVTSAHNMKNDGAAIYSIGIFEGADPGVTSGSGETANANQFMNAVSSNYPNATAYNQLGQRGEGDYYKATSDANELNTIFEDIFKEEQEDNTSGSPIEENTQQGNTEPGILTFEDQLGNYMQVTGTDAGKDKIQLAYGDKIYTSTSKSTQDNTDTYHFEGQVEGNEIYGPANLSDLVVTVERSDDLATGDKVTVTLPASLLPMRHYDVDTDANTMTVSQAYPVRLFYGVSLKADAKTALGNPTSEAYADIVKSQASDDGTSIDFYSNSFTKGAADGSTTTSFSPNAGNKFYYYTQDTTLYTNPECTTEANWYTARNANTLYYKDVYWVQTGNGNGAREVTDGYGTVTSGTAEWNAIVRPYQGGAYYIPANTQRTERPHTLTDGKDPNATGTAANVLNPSWTEAGDVTQALGNNGKLSFEKPGSLEIKKNVDWGNASDQTKQEKNTFTFDITANVPTGEGEATEALTGTYNYYVGDSDAAAGQVTFNNGSTTLTVTGGTTVRIDGLPAGTTFTVTEQGVGQNGWTVTDATSQEGVENTNTTDGMVTGTIPAGSQASLTFSNTYHANEVNLNTNTTLKVQKNLEGRDWRDTDSFDFTITGFRAPSGVDPVPVPEDTVVTVDASTDAYTASFGNITFDTPGEYRYTIQENGDPEQPIAGIDYSDAIYRVTVMVGDDGIGSLVIDSVKIELMYDDGGNLANTENEGTPVEGDTMAFKNTYNASTDTEGIQGKKVYNDTTGDNPYEGGKFSFKLEAQGGFVTDSGNADDLTIAAANTPMPDNAQDNAVTTTNVGSDFTFPTITFDGNDAGNTYVYKVTEVNTGEPGMAYSNAEHTVQISVKEVTDGDGTHIVATVQAPYNNPQNLVFENTYDPADATLTGDDAIHGTKTLTGRDMKDGETFYFQLTATNANAQSVLPNAKTVKVTSLTDGSADFNFGDMSFSKVGKYTFTVNEVADENGTETTDGSGMTYDTNICTVTVDVSDNHDGTLKADVTYSNNVNSSVTDKAQFNNTYEASMNYGAEGAGGIVVTKTLNDRAEENNTFLFTITGKTEEDTAKLHDQDRKFSHGPLTPGVPNEMEKLQQLTFDETDAGKTYTFIVDELEDEFGPNESVDTLKGVDFDQSQYRVDIKVLDNGDGTMHTVTTVTKTMNADGSVVDEAVYGPSDSATDGYMAPKFGFVNDYNPDPAVVGGSANAKIQVTKTVEGADSAADYTFTLTLEDQDQAKYIEGLDNGKLEVSTSGTITEGDSQTVEFGELKFTKAGSYRFTVTENQPAEDAGWTFDDADGDGATDTHYVGIVITDKNADGKYDGKLYVESVTSDAGLDQPVQITNSYKTDPVVVGGEDAEQQITVQKSVTGDNTAADAEFNFQLEPVVDDTNTEDVWRANVEAAEDGFEPKTTITGGVTTDAPKTATFGGIRFKAAGDYTFKVTEVEGTDDQADPSGWKYDGHEAFVTVHVTDDGEGKLEATVSYNNDGATTEADKAVDNAAAFTNAYSASSTDADTGSANVQLTKVLEGKAWDGDSFTFQIAADESNPDAPMPKDTEVTVSAPTGKDDNNNDQATFDFGKITFDTPGTYVYKVTEVEGDNAGITYSKNEATITITVTDNHQGALVATVGIENNVFTNTYASELDYAAGGGLKIAKTFENATMREFSFTVTPKDQPSADKLHIDMAGKTFTTKPGETVGDDNASHAEVAVLDAAAEAKFTQDDVDDTYTYTVKETAGSDAGVTYDDTEYTVTITTEDDGQGGIKVTTTVTDGADYTETYVYDNDDATDQTAVVPFTNTYKAEGQLGGNGAVSIKATKTLTNRPMVDGEFTFNVTNANDDSNTVVATGTNDANGTITFSAINYSIDQMLENVDNGLATPGVADGKDTFTYTYKVTEDTASLDDGVSAIDAAGFQITVTVTDNGDGTLGIAVAYPDGNDGLTFRNTYGEGQTGQATLNINGTKTLKVASGDNAPNIEGKYTFTLTGSKGAPMPATTEAHNDAAGNVAFGDITFTMENVFGDTGSQDAATNAEGDGTEEAVSAQSAIRTKEFTYTVTESGSVAGVDNDAEASKTFTVTVTDNGDGTLSVASNPAQGALFTFTNTYSVEPEESSPTGEGGITITKNLAGRNLNEGEFTFELVDQSGATVATGTNEANGNVGLGTVKFTEPGRFTYTIREAKGSLGGVNYDAAEYKATAGVTDNGDGTLAVTWSFATAAGEPASAIDFNNTYTATPTSVLLGGTKVLDGRALAEGEFTFVLNDAGGNELQTVTNNAQGGFCFDQITYDAAGTYEYTISEVRGDAEGVTYDDATIAVKVVVTDNGKGALEVTELTYDGRTELPVFTNTYVKPVEPPKDDSGLMQTGDSTSTFVGVIAGLGALSVAVGLVARKRHGE